MIHIQVFQSPVDETICDPLPLLKADECGSALKASDGPKGMFVDRPCGANNSKKYDAMTQMTRLS